MLRKTVADVVREIGLEYMPGVSFDFALPMGFVWDAEAISGGRVPGRFVWLYDSRGGLFGRPYPLDYVAVDILHTYNVAQSHHYPEDMFFG